MFALKKENDFVELPKLFGRFDRDVPLGKQSWFRCGGKAELVYHPADLDDLAEFLKGYPAEQSVMVLGGMANTIVRDGGIRGCVVQLGKPFAEVEVTGEDTVTVGAGALNGTVASVAAKNGVGGLEFLSGIPGTVGGALRMNAGAYGSEVKDILIEAEAIDRQGQVHVLKPEDLKMSYRSTELPEGYIFTGAVFRGREEDSQAVREKLKEIKARRNETQPIREKTGGSTFANPTDAELEACGLPPGTKAWELVKGVYGHEIRVGGARMSEKHCNFMVNTGNATADDLESLGEVIFDRVRKRYCLHLRWEIARVGEVV